MKVDYQYYYRQIFVVVLLRVANRYIYLSTYRMSFSLYLSLRPTGMDGLLALNICTRADGPLKHAC